MAMYYLGKNGQQSGPFSMEQLQGMVSSGQIAPADLLWTQGMVEWKPASSILPALFPGQPTPPSFGAQPAATTSPLVAAPTPPQQNIPTYLWQLIVLTVLCCPVSLPFGIAGIVFAIQVNSKLAAGDIAGAAKASKNAKILCWVTLIVGVIGTIIGVLMSVPAMLSKSALRY